MECDSKILHVMLSFGCVIQCLSEQNEVNSSFPRKVNNLLLDTHTITRLIFPSASMILYTLSVYIHIGEQKWPISHQEFICSYDTCVKTQLHIRL